MQALHLCNGDQALLSAKEEEEYNILKEHVTFNLSADPLELKYPFCKDRSVLVNNWKEAKACQVSQERRQLRDGTHSQYME